MADIRALVAEGTRLRDAGDMEGANRIADQIVLAKKQQSYEGNIPRMAGHAAVHGISGIGDIIPTLTSEADKLSRINLARAAGVPPIERQEINPSPVTGALADLGMTYKSDEELPPGMRPYAHGIETFSGALAPGGLVGAPAKMGMNVLKSKPVTEGLGFLGGELASAFGSGQLSTGAELVAPDNEAVRAGAELVGGAGGGVLGSLGSLYRGAKEMAGRGVGAVSGFMRGAKGAPPGAVDELSQIMNQLQGRVGGDAAGLKDLLTRLSNGKISPETRALYQSILANDDPAKGIGAILKSNKPESTLAELYKAARRGKKGVVDELHNAVIGSVWDSASTDGVVSLTKLKSGLFGGRRSVAKMLEANGIAPDDLRALQELIDKGAELEAKGVDPKVAFDLVRELQNAAVRIGGARAGGHLSRALNIGGIQMQALGAGMATRMAKAGGGSALTPFLNSLGGKGSNPTQDAIKLRGYIAQALQSATGEEEE